MIKRIKSYVGTVNVLHSTAFNSFSNEIKALINTLENNHIQYYLRHKLFAVEPIKNLTLPKIHISSINKMGTEDGLDQIKKKQ